MKSPQKSVRSEKKSSKNRQRNSQKKYVSNEQLEPSYKPCVNGKNVFRYYLNDNYEYVNFIPSAIKSGGKTEVYENEKIFVRQIGERPIAMIGKKGIYSLNTVFNIYMKITVLPF